MFFQPVAKAKPVAKPVSKPNQLQSPPQRSQSPLPNSLPRLPPALSQRVKPPSAGSSSSSDLPAALLPIARPHPHRRPPQTPRFPDQPKEKRRKPRPSRCRESCCRESCCEKAAADANKPPVEAEPEQEEPVVEDKPEPVVKPEANKKPAKPVKKPAKTEPEPKPVESAAAPAPVAPAAPAKREVNLPAACQGKRLEEHAVGPNMAQFRNNAVSIKDFNEFRVLITQPDATGATTFCVWYALYLLDDFDLTLVLVDDSRDVGVGQVRKGMCKEA
ncbi:hypothetical protein B0H13DRAFT_2523944 [Mycena leptocephala]|nr:hypothetical protein B0H13DRAFT_2523944 [Mycena leptocephala]